MNEPATKGVARNMLAGFLFTQEIKADKFSEAKALLRICTLCLLRYGDA